MITVTRIGTKASSDRRRAQNDPLSAAEIENGALQEGEDLDFKREVNLDKVEAKSRFLDDIVAFLNRGQGRIIVGVEEAQGRFAGFRPLPGDADKTALRLQTMIQDSISPLPVDVRVVPLLVEGGFILDVQIPRNLSGPFMNRLSGGYLIRSGSRNLPIDPGMLRSRLVDETSWLRRVEELTAQEDASIAAAGRLARGQALRIGILPREHFDHRRAPFEQDDVVRRSSPAFHAHSRMGFRACEDGHDAVRTDFKDRDFERLFVRDDWFVHAHIAFALQESSSGEGSLALGEFDENVRRYLKEIADFFAEQSIEGPFAIVLALQALNEDDRFSRWFRGQGTVRTLRPQMVAAVDDPDMITSFLRKVRQASVYGY